MHRTLAGLALGALLASSYSGAALAATSIDTAGFALTFVDGPLPEDWNINLTGQSGNTFSISLDSLTAHLAPIEVQDVTGVGSWDSRSDWSQLRLDVHAGYRVTGLSISGTALGDVAAGQLPGFPPGRASNAANFYLTVWSPGAVSYGHQFNDFEGERSLAAASGALSLVAPTEIGLSGVLTAEAWGVEGDGAFAGSLARAGLRDLVLHVDVAPVPEPATWSMLMAGLGLVAVARRAKKC